MLFKCWSNSENTQTKMWNISKPTIGFDIIICAYFARISASRILESARIKINELTDILTASPIIIANAATVWNRPKTKIDHIRKLTRKK